MNSPNNQHNPEPELLPGELLAVILLTGAFVLFIGGFFTLVVDAKAALMGEIFIIVPALGYVRYKKLDIRQTFRLNMPNAPVLLYSLIIALVSFVLIDEIDRLISLRFPMPEEQLQRLKDLLTVHSLGEGVLVFVAAVLVASIAEEMFFRGFVQRNFEFYSDPAMTMVMVSVFFTLTHFSFELAIQILILGMILAYTSWKADSIFPAVIIHAVNNLFSLLLLNLPEEQTIWYAGENHVKPVWIILALLALVPAFKKFNLECSKMTE